MIRSDKIRSEKHKFQIAASLSLHETKNLSVTKRNVIVTALSKLNLTETLQVILG